jgi:DeoR/GlpR family transcriptional regulator of sugar metabolism
MMNDDPTVIRQWRMLRMLGVRRHGIVVSDMALEFRVSAKTIRRDLQKLTTRPLLLEAFVRRNRSG